MNPVHTSTTLTIAGGIGVITAFVQTVLGYAGLAASAHPALGGLDAALGVPATGVLLAVLGIVTAVGVGGLAGGRLPRWFWLAFTVVTGLAVVFAAVATITSFTVLGLIASINLVAAFITALRQTLALRGVGYEPQSPVSGRAWALGGFLVIAGVLGWLAAIELSIDKVAVYVDPQASLTCDFNLLVQCNKNLQSAEGSAFGFPNPIIGLGGFAAPFLVGVMTLAGARFGRWFWIAFNIGVAGALGLVVFLITASIFHLTTLCPWCMVVWSVVIPTFWLVTLFNAKSGHFGGGTRALKRWSGVYTYVPIITLVCYLVVAVIAQLRLDVLSYVF